MAPKRTCECGTCAKCKHRDYMNEYYRRNPQRIRDIALASRMRRIEDVRAYDRERGHHGYDKEKERARALLGRAVRRGDIERGSCAVGEDCDGPIHAHHDDYSRPLDVVWLCQKHHAIEHRVVT